MSTNPFPLVLDNFGTTRLLYLEETQSVVQVTLALHPESNPTLTSSVFDRDKYFIQELILHALLALEAASQPSPSSSFTLPDGLVLLSNEPESDGDERWELHLTRSAWKLATTYDFFSDSPATVTEDQERARTTLTAWSEKFTFLFKAV